MALVQPSDPNKMVTRVAGISSAAGAASILEPRGEGRGRGSSNDAGLVLAVDGVAEEVEGGDAVDSHEVLVVVVDGPEEGVVTVHCDVGQVGYIPAAVARAVASQIPLETRLPVALPVEPGSPVKIKVLRFEPDR